MERATRARLLAAVALGLCLTAAGCGGAKPTQREVKGVPVSGQLVQNGKTIKLKGAETITISFVLAGGSPADQIAALAEYNPDDGSFVVKGPTGQGIPPGKYKVGLSNDFTDGGGGPERFGEDFDSEKTPLAADVGTEEGQVFVIDVGTKRVTRKK
jgi:hypothetical protein